MTNDTVLGPQQILHLWDTRVNEPSDKYPLLDGDKLHFARAIEQAVLQSLPYQNSFSIRGDSYAGVYVWVGNENLVQHIPKVLAQTANDPQSMLSAVAAECIQELKRFSELQSAEVQAWKKDAEAFRLMVSNRLTACVRELGHEVEVFYDGECLAWPACDPKADDGVRAEVTRSAIAEAVAAIEKQP